MLIPKVPIPELEKCLGFKYLPKNTFETPLILEEVLAKGLAQKVNNAIKEESLNLGRQFASQINAAYLSASSVRLINNHVGHGLFAEEDIPTGSYVGEYTGVIRKNDRRYFEPLNDYCYEYPVPDEIGRNFVIDATHGNLTRFINHSYSPNLKPIYAFLGGFFHLIFIAILPVPKGSQLTYNYGSNYWYLRDPPSTL